MKQGSFKQVVFRDRPIRVTVWSGRGLCVIDPERQTEVRPGRVRVWIGYENKERVLDPNIRIHDPPGSAAQTNLAVSGYAAFLDPLLPRPDALNSIPYGYTPPADSGTAIGYDYGENDRIVTDEADPWNNTSEDDEDESLYDDVDGDEDPARPRLPTVNYTGLGNDD